ncbi:MAG: AAA family ATPase [Sulfuricurvum sp.]
MAQHLYNIDIERTLLSSLIFEPQLFEEHFHALTTNNLFFHASHQAIFRAILHLQSEDHPVEEGLINTYLTKNSEHYEAELLQILTANPAASIQAYIKELTDLSEKRTLISIVNEFSRDLQNESFSGNTLLSRTLEKLEVFQQTHRVSLLDMHDISTLQGEEAEFLCKAWLPFPKKTVSMISAPGGSGKSWLVLQLMMHHSIENPHSKSFAWLSEDPTGLTAHRAQKIATTILGKELKEFTNKIVISNSPTIQVLEEQGRGISINPYFNDLKKSLAPYDLIILDPLIAFFGADENNNAHARKFMQLFTEWASRENKTIVFIHHSTKNTTQARGASAFTDAVRLVYEISYATNKDGTPDETRSHLRKITLTKDNYGASKPLGGKQIVRQIFPEVKPDASVFMKDF